MEEQKEPVTYDMMQVTAPINKQSRKPGDPCHTLAKGNAANAAVVYENHGQDSRIKEVGVVPQLNAKAGTGGGNLPLAQMNNTIRRLTPTEAERLQGFPDGYTAIPYKGRPAEQCPDGPRYKALGNSWAVPVAAWIGRRIAEVDKKYGPTAPILKETK